MEQVTKSWPWPDDRRGPWRAEVTIGGVEGRRVCIGLSISGPDGDCELRASTVRRHLRLGELTRRALDEVAFDESTERIGSGGRQTIEPRGATVQVTPGAVVVGDDLVAAFAAVKPPTGRGRPRRYENYRIALDAYRTAYRNNKPPRKAVEEALVTSPENAARIIRELRDVGLLPETTKGKANA